MSNFMEYSNRTHSNIIPKEDFENLIHEVFETISTNLSQSLGPLGSSTTILDGMMTDSTKDGFTIFKNIRFHNRYKQMIYNLMKVPCTTLNNTVGDGTTTAIVLTNSLFSEYKRHKSQLESLYRLPRHFTKAWDSLIQEIIKKIQSYAKPVDPSDRDTIWNIAYVVSNGNIDISNNFAKTYMNAKSPNIKIKNSPTNKSYISPIVGFDFPANLISEAYVRTEDLSANLNERACVIVIDHKIDVDTFNNLIVPINDVYRHNNTKVIVIAPSYDAYLAGTYMEQYLNREFQKYKDLNLILTQYEPSKLDFHQLEDLSAVLNMRIIDQGLASKITNYLESNKSNPDDSYDLLTNEWKNEESEFYGFLGCITSAQLSCTNGSVLVPDDIENNDKYKRTLKLAENELDEIISATDHELQSYAFKIAKARDRVSRLKMNNYVYYVGADSNLQKRIIEDAVVDVNKCIKSALKTGVVPGCQLSIIKACVEITKGITSQYASDDVSTYIMQDKCKLAILELIYNAVLETYGKILHGPEGLGIVKTLDNWQECIYDSSKSKELASAAVTRSKEIISKSIDTNQVFDLETLSFSDTIITSAETDIMVLTASSELVKLLISGNQCVFLDSEVNDSHTETVEAYV